MYALCDIHKNVCVCAYKRAESSCVCICTRAGECASVCVCYVYTQEQKAVYVCAVHMEARGTAVRVSGVISGCEPPEVVAKN